MILQSQSQSVLFGAVFTSQYEAQQHHDRFLRYGTTKVQPLYIAGDWFESLVENGVVQPRNDTKRRNDVRISPHSAITDSFVPNSTNTRDLYAPVVTLWPAGHSKEALHPFRYFDPSPYSNSSSIELGLKGNRASHEYTRAGHEISTAILRAFPRFLVAATQATDKVDNAGKPYEPFVLGKGRRYSVRPSTVRLPVGFTVPETRFVRKLKSNELEPRFREIDRQRDERIQEAIERARRTWERDTESLRMS
ncbi:MAG: hypothetical protein AB7P76_04335 [Candidatus Melainabacteria bacterium]